MKRVEIYTDGACSGNPGPGGYCAILSYGGREKIVSGGVVDTTNNRMEILAVTMGLRALKEPCEVAIYSDSAYTIDAFQKGWIRAWQKNGWRTADNKPVKNPDLWTELSTLVLKHDVTFVKVKGHSDNENNNRCDEIARAEIKKLDMGVSKNASAN